MKRAGAGLVAAAILFAAAACSASSSGGGATASSQVEDHVHGAIAGPRPGSLLIATHYGLATSTDGGRAWTTDGGLGDEMIAGIVRTSGTYVAALQMMPGMSMPSLPGSGMQMDGHSMAGMDMSSGSMTMPNVAFSQNAKSWSSPTGFPSNAQVAALTVGATAGTVWASVLGHGIYESTDSGHSWQLVIPAAVPISSLAAVGPNLLMATPSGVFVTGAQGPSMPGLAQLNGSVNDLTVLPSCEQCVAAAGGNGGISISRNGGVTWTRHHTPTTFDELYASGDQLYGLVPSAGKDEGIWRSVDGGLTWRHVLTTNLVDHMYAESSSKLLAFGWGIRVYRSTDGGRAWKLLTHLHRPAS